MKYRIIGIDLAKNVFQVCALDHHSGVAFNKRLSRKKFPEFIQQLPPSLIAMEACGSSNYWARKFIAMGHDIRLVPAQHVKAFVLGNKNDSHDALAICETALRPKMHFVPVKTVAHQEVQFIHRLRQRYMGNRTAIVNQIRAMLRENGINLPTSLSAFRRNIPTVLGENETLSPTMLALVQESFSEVLHLDEQIKNMDERLQQQIKQNDDCQRLLKIPGFGPIVSSALVAAVGDARHFKKGKQMAAWVGLAPRHYASGERSIMLSTSKMGDPYLRYLMIHGARALVTWCDKKDDRLSRWLQTLIQRRGKNKATVAMANKMARMAWVVLSKGEDFKTAEMMH